MQTSLQAGAILEETQDTCELCGDWGTCELCAVFRPREWGSRRMAGVPVSSGIITLQAPSPPRNCEFPFPNKIELAEKSELLESNDLLKMNPHLLWSSPSYRLAPKIELHEQLPKIAKDLAEPPNMMSLNPQRSFADHGPEPEQQETQSDIEPPAAVVTRFSHQRQRSRHGAPDALLITFGPASRAMMIQEEGEENEE